MTNNIGNYKSVLNRLKTPLNKRCSFFVLFSTLFLLISSCATVQQPTGGPKDETPPKILSIVPENLTRNFDKREITIEFDEFIKLKNESTEISISPDMEVAPIYKVNRKSLLITLPDSLEKNTTYSINFGNAVVDYNEGNELKNFSYVFSTGPKIDSLSISGSVSNALTLEKEKDVTVLLIPTRQDSIFRKKKANIFTKTDSSGNFTLKNLHEDAYRIYALKETNKDRIYNSPDELIGFLKDSIQLKRDTSGIKLILFKEIPKDFRIMNRLIDNKGKISILFNKPLVNPSITILNESTLDTEKITEFTPTKDTAYVWLPKLEFDSLAIQIKDGNVVLDTAKLKRNKKDEYDTKITLTDNLTGRKVDKIKNLVVTASAPIKSFDKSKIILTEDSIRRENFQLSLDPSFNRKVLIKYNWKSKRNYEVEFQEGAFTGYFGEKSTDGKLTFTYDDTENYGDIAFDIMLPDTNQNYLVQLLNEKNEVVLTNSIDKNGKINLKNVPGTKYKVRIVYDVNKNNKWDTGNVEEGIQPEKVWFWNKIITIRPNWEQEESIIIPPATATDQKKEENINSETESEEDSSQDVIENPEEIQVPDKIKKEEP
jgi:hypothetical protein